ncbi:MAG TPA: hemerythrin domain-containing protein [Candidatus Acidoferrales bacterium]|jgi:hemerythrin-like domain-containing protein|nr:hemerythrin domain-containing protein [Candidatus Acidoferrales bacterium]
MADQCIRHLLQEHRATEEVLAALDALLDSIVLEPAWNTDRCTAFAHVRQFVASDWPLHECKEDTVLFPALVGFLPSDTGPLEVLRSEFATISFEAARMVECAMALCSTDTTPKLSRNFLHAARSFSQLLRDHIYKEDRVLFPMVARYLPAEKDAELLAAMSRCCPPVKIAGASAQVAMRQLALHVSGIDGDVE